MRNILFASIILAQGYTVLPNGRAVFSPPDLIDLRHARALLKETVNG